MRSKCISNISISTLNFSFSNMLNLDVTFLEIRGYNLLMFAPLHPSLCLGTKGSCTMLFSYLLTLVFLCFLSYTYKYKLLRMTIFYYYSPNSHILRALYTHYHLLSYIQILPFQYGNKCKKILVKILLQTVSSPKFIY